MTGARPPAARCGAPAKDGSSCRCWADEGERCVAHGGGGRTRAPDPYLPGKPPCAECPRHARTLVEDRPLCTRHAAAAEQEARFWQEMFTPTPDAPYRGDPGWQAAQREIVNPLGRNASERTAAAVAAIYRRQEIEARFSS